MNHPKRSKRSEMAESLPSCHEIVVTRRDAGITQSQAASMVHASLRAWQEWESGQRLIHPASWELFCLKVGK